MRRNIDHSTAVDDVNDMGHDTNRLRSGEAISEGAIAAADFDPTAIADLDDIITARPTDDETINEFGRRLALIPSEYDELGWSEEPTSEL